MARMLSKKGFELGIAVNKQMVKQYIQKDQNNRDQVKCYLQNGTQFQIFLRNFRVVPVIVELSINGQKQGDGILMDPMQAFFLERFLTDTKKLVFNTYQMSEQIKDIIKQKTNIGAIEVSVYAIQSAYDSTVSPTITLPNYSPEITWTNTGTFDSSYYANNLSNNNNHFLTGSVAPTRLVNSSNMVFSVQYNAQPAASYEKVELGCIEKGASSKQAFDPDCDWVRGRLLESYQLTLSPMSEKTAKDAEGHPKGTYCSNCQRRAREKEIFCPKCGTKY